jgi:hypothetical protein
MMIMKSPTSPGQVGSMIASLAPDLSLSSMVGAITPKSKAAVAGYDYGVPKFGFSLTEQNDPRFEDPYENGTRPLSDCGQEKCPSIEEDLDRLNEEYGKPCFGMEVTENSKGGVSIKSEKAVDVFTLYTNPDTKDKCDGQKNRSDRFNQYRMYVADAVNAVTLACYEGDNDACAEIGFGQKSNSTTDSTPSEESKSGTVSEDAQELAKELLKSNNVDLTNFCRYCMEDIKNTSEGKPAYSDVKLNVKLLQFLVELTKESKNAKVDINSITGEGCGHAGNTCRSAGGSSEHYKGEAVDFQCNGISGAVLDRVGKRYGIKSNWERCDAGVNHWHYSLSGR